MHEQSHPLVFLVNEGTQTWKKDAAIALFHLYVYHDNRGTTVRVGVVSSSDVD